MKYRFYISVFNHTLDRLFSTTINGNSVQEVAAYYLGRYHIEELNNGKEIKTRMTRVEFHLQELN